MSKFQQGALATAPAARLPARLRLTRVRVTLGRYELVFAGVVAIALAARVIDLTAKPFHHDESEHAWFAWLLFNGHGYHYNPVFHGPVQFYVMTLLYLLLGVGDLAARLAPALVGTLVVGLPYLLRRQIGSVAALSAGVLLCISPSYLYFSRFVREDIYAACLTLGLIAAIFRFLDRPRPWHPSVILGLLAISFATKESTFITVAVFGSFFVVALVWQARRSGSVRRARLAVTARSVGRDAWIWGVATFVTVFTLLFTTFLTNPHGLQDGLIDGIRYWVSQQPVNRGSNPPFYYLVVLPAYEWPVVLLAALGIVAVIRRPTLLGLFLVWDFVISLALYSAAGERMPWLTLHPLLPLILLAGVGMQTLWTNRRAVPARIALALALVAAAWSIWTGAALSYRHPADPREMLVFTQTSVDVPPIRDADCQTGQLDALASRAKPAPRSRRLVRERLAVGVVSARNGCGLSGHEQARFRADRRRLDRHRREPSVRAASAPRLPGHPLPPACLVGCRLRRRLRPRLGPLVHPPPPVGSLGQHRPVALCT